MAKSGTHFHFKQFSVRHDRCSMKVGTDGVLLGAWAEVRDVKSVLDIGTGSGVIALMLAQRCEQPVSIDGIELDVEAATQANENAQQSPWSKHVAIHCTSLQQYSPEKKYDLIVSNPPYFINSQEPPDKKRLQTRHTVTLTFEELLQGATRLLSDTGTLEVILPYTEGLQFIALARTVNLFCSRQWSFRTRANKPIERWLLAFSRMQTEMIETGEILLYDMGTELSPSYRKLTGAFYLNA